MHASVQSKSLMLRSTRSLRQLSSLSFRPEVNHRDLRPSSDAPIQIEFTESHLLLHAQKPDCHYLFYIMKTTISTASPVRIGRQRRMSEPTGPKPSSRKGYFYFLYEELLLSLSELLCRTRGHDGRKFVCSYQGRLLTLDRTLPYWEYILVLFSRSGCKLWEWQQLVK